MASGERSNLTTRLPRLLRNLAMTKKEVGFVIFTTLGIYTHYYMFFVLGAQGLFLLGQFKSVAGDYWIGGIDKRTHYEALLRILGGEQKNLLRPWLFGLSIILLAVGIVQHALRDPSRSSGQRFEKPYLLIWLWAVVPFILATLPGFKFDGIHLPFRPIFFWRYLIGSSIPLSMVMVHSAQKFPKYLMWGSVGILLLLSLVIDFWTFASYP